MAADELEKSERSGDAKAPVKTRKKTIGKKVAAKVAAGNAVPAAAATENPATNEVDRAANETAPKTPAAKTPVPKIRELVQRLKILAEKNLILMEKHMDGGKGGRTSEQREHTTRTVGALVKTIEKITELSPARKKPLTKRADANATAAVRRELAERLYKLWGGPRS